MENENGQRNQPSTFPGEELLRDNKPLPSFIPLPGTRVVTFEDTDAIIVADEQHRALLAIHVGDLTSDRDSDDNTITKPPVTLSIVNSKKIRALTSFAPDSNL